MKRKNQGFTLAELLIVVAIIAVLVAISIPIFIGKVILLNVSKDGEINVKWIGREEYRKVNHGD